MIMLTSSKRAEMAAIRQKDTAPELRVRRWLHRAGFRFRLHRSDLDGTPDIVLPRHKLCIFVHGCFWHQHTDCMRATLPRTNVEFWREKFLKNRERDLRVATTLRAAGWRVAIIWECQTKTSAKLDEAIRTILGNGTQQNY